MVSWQMPGRRNGPMLPNELSAKRIHDSAIPMMVVMAVVVAFVRFDPMDTIRPFEGAEVIGCDGRMVSLDGREAELLRLHNEVRAEQGVEELCVQENLMVAAQGHAEDMIERDFYAHETPEGLTPGDRITRAGYPFATYGENNNRVSGGYSGEPGRDELRDAFESWMESPPHRANLLDPDFREVGIGLSTGQYTPEVGTTTMYVVDFATRR